MTDSVIVTRFASEVKKREIYDQTEKISHNGLQRDHYFQVFLKQIEDLIQERADEGADSLRLNNKSINELLTKTFQHDHKDAVSFNYLYIKFDFLSRLPFHLLQRDNAWVELSGNPDHQELNYVIFSWDRPYKYSLVNRIRLRMVNRPWRLKK